MNKDEFLKDFTYIDPCSPAYRDSNKWDLHGENKYCPVVKVTNWWYHREAYPKDHDDFVHAAYKRWGTQEDKTRWTTETGWAMCAGRGDDTLVARRKKARVKKMLGFISYPTTLKTRIDIMPDEIRRILPSLSRDEMMPRYTTTNQAHYKKVHILPKSVLSQKEKTKCSCQKRI